MATGDVVITFPAGVRELVEISGDEYFGWKAESAVGNINVFIVPNERAGIVKFIDALNGQVPDQEILDIVVETLQGSSFLYEGDPYLGSVRYENRSVAFNALC